MSKLKVGDIEIDDHEVRIKRRDANVLDGSTSVTYRSAMYSRRPAALPRADYAFLKSVPLRPGFIILLGVAVSFLGLVGTLVQAPFRSVVDVLLHGTFLIPIGVGIALIGILKAVHQDSSDRRDVARADGVTEEFISELGELLRHEDRSHTVEWVQNRLGWNHDDVVRTLAWLRERGELREEIDMETGHYYYVSTPSFRSLDARLMTTNSNV